MFLQDPILSRFKADIAKNTPFMLLWFVFRFLVMIALIAVTTDGFFSYACSSESMNTTTACFQRTHLEEYILGYHRFIGGFQHLTVHEIGDLVTIAKHIYDQTRCSNRNLYDKRHLFVYGVLHSYCVFEFSTEIIFEYLILREDAINKTKWNGCF